MVEHKGCQRERGAGNRDVRACKAGKPRINQFRDAAGFQPASDQRDTNITNDRAHRSSGGE